MTQLALVAALLMLLAPLVSRALLAVPASPSEPAAAPHAMHGDMQGMAHHASHGMSHGGEHAHHTASSAAVASTSAPVADPHAAHGEACDYCVLAARLLPWLALCIVLLPLLWRLPALLFLPTLRLPAQRWPAHAARGPPALLLVR